jgi:hypothetical protein
VQVGTIESIKEVWGHKDGAMKLISRSSIAIEGKEVQWLIFR